MSLLIFILSLLPSLNAITSDLLFNDHHLHSKALQQISKLSSPKQIRPPLIKVTSRLSELPRAFMPPSSENASIAFWLSIFSQYNSSTVVFHDKRDVSTIFNSFKLPTENLSDPFLKSYINSILLDRLILSVKSKIPLPAREYLRIQSGQSDIIANSLRNLKQFYSTVSFIISELKAPHLLLPLSILESHFDLNAVSSAGAVGAWQFMKPVSNFFLPISSFVDYRLSPYLSTIAAIHLLKQNKMILKKWPLAILAYNMGVTRIRKIRKHHKSYEKVISHRSVGFAPRNYYSEFIAIVLATSSILTTPASHTKTSLYRPFISICPSVRSQFPFLYDLHNNHIPTSSRSIPRGLIIYSNRDLPLDFFLPIPKKIRTRKYPKSWPRLLKNYSCSTK